MNVNRRQQLLAVAAGLALAVLIGDRLVLTPLTASWKARSARIVDLRKRLSQGQVLIAREHTIRDRWDSMRTNTLPTEPSLAQDRLLQAFERWAGDSRVGINSIRPQWKHSADDYVTLECQVDATGSMPALTKFLHNLESDSLGIKVESLEITARDDAGEQLALALLVSGLQLPETSQTK